RVHREILQSEGLPENLEDSKAIWDDRFRSILDLEKHLDRNGTKIVKFFLHVSQEEQRKRFLKRLDDPQKNWKFSSADIEERKLWPDYMHAFEDCMKASITNHAPCYVGPADDKLNARLVVSQIVVDTLDSLKMSYPTPSSEERAKLKAIRKALEK